MKQKLSYVSPSSIPSSSANSIHVVLQCAALLSEGVDVQIFANRSVKNKPALIKAVFDAYGVDLGNADFLTFYSATRRFINIRIALLAILHLAFKRNAPLVLSRNLYFSFFYAVFMGKRMLFETHQVEHGFRKTMQRWIMKKHWVQTIVVSHKLEEILAFEHGIAPATTIVLHDAAPDGLPSSTKGMKDESLTDLVGITNENWRAVCGYFGQLYEGRGIEIIEEMARARPDVLFLVFGGNRDDIVGRRNANRDLPNIYFGGHVSHSKVQKIMKNVDFLLMPYQKKVSIGVKGHDTGRWMSPMKMHLSCLFHYFQQLFVCWKFFFF